MGILSRFGHKFHTATLIAEYFRTFRQGVGPYDMVFFDKPWFTDAGIGRIVDVGANTGQFAVMVSTLLPQASLFSFEPIPECHAELVAQLHRHPKFKSFNVGLADQDGILEFEKNEFTPSSSFLPLTETHRNSFPHAAKTTKIEVQVRRLDSYESELRGEGKLLVKIDTQGYELPVINGGRRVIANADIVIVEMSFASLYEDQPLFDDVYEALRNLGLRLAGIHGVSHDQLTGKCLQCDGIFLRQDHASRS
jgi:FkbM family methyltransferase